MSSADPDSTSDTQNLIPAEDEARRPFYKRHKWCLGIFFSIILIVIGHVLAVYFIYYSKCSSDVKHCIPMKVMAYNTWGMPKAFGSKFKELRMPAIAEEFRKGEYDIYLFEELWMEADHTTIANATPPGYFMTGFR